MKPYALFLLLTFGFAPGPASAQAPAPALAAPQIVYFYPRSGPAGTTVTVLGSGFDQATRVAFGGVPATFKVAFGRLITTTVPAAAATGPITVTTPQGLAASANPFTVPGHAGPTLTAFTPSQGPVGTVVTLTGTGFTTAAKVAFNGTAAPAVTFVSATQLKASVPAGASTGFLTVTTSAGTATSALAFTVPGGTPGGTDLFVGGWYLSQGVQTLSRSVPLVAGKTGCLRVFAQASGANALRPAVRVTVTGGSPSPWVQTIPAPGAAVPTALAEGTLASSWNLTVPGAVLAPGATLKLELDPAGAVPEANKTNNVVQAALDVRAAAPFKTTLIPVIQQGLTGTVVGGGRTLATWVARFHAMYPVPDAIDAQLGAPYTTQANLNDASGSGWSTLLGELDRKRVAEGTGRYYFGAVNVSYSGGIAGLGYVGGPTAIGWDKTGYGDGGDYNDVFTHEVGHNLDRQHAPCGGPSGVDPSWPADAAHAGAKIGVYGLDVANGILKAPSAFTDVMAYCHPVWASDYTYKGILAWRSARHLEGIQKEGAQAPPFQQCLLISGAIRDGHLQLDPAFRLCTRPAPPSPGPYTLELQDRQGRTLVRVPFTAHRVADGPPGDDRHYAFAVPLAPEVDAALNGLRVFGPTGGILSRTGSPGPVYQRPQAFAAGPHRVRLQWDHLAFPTAMVRDPYTGQTLAFASGGTAEVATDAPRLEVTLSDGVLSHRFILRPD